MCGRAQRCCCVQHRQGSATHSRFLPHASLGSSPGSLPSGCAQPDPTAVSPHCSGGTRCCLVWEVRDTGEQRLRLSQQLLSSPLSHGAPVSVGRAVAGGQPAAARVCPRGCKEPLPRSRRISVGVAEYGQCSVFVKDLFSLCPNY